MVKEVDGVEATDRIKGTGKAVGLERVTEADKCLETDNPRCSFV